MRPRSLFRFVLALSLCPWTAQMAGCSKPAEPPAAVPPPAAVAPGGAASTNGTVVGKGPAPAVGASVVVVLESKTPRQFAAQTDKPVMDQVGTTFGPELLIVRTGQPVEFRNNDDTLHNVNVKEEGTRVQSFNVAIPTDGVYEFTFPHDGFYRVGCDIHPAMAASIFAATTPYTTLADSEGRFTFEDVPAGSWIVTVYAGGKRLHKDVEITGGVTNVTIE
jgi:plastocyanin